MTNPGSSYEFSGSQPIANGTNGYRVVVFGTSGNYYSATIEDVSIAKKRGKDLQTEDTGDFVAKEHQLP